MKHRLRTDFKTRPPKPFEHKNGYYYIRQYILGKDIWRSLGTKNKEEAEMLSYNIWYSQQNKDIQKIYIAPYTEIEFAWDDYKDSDSFQLLKKSTQKNREKIFFAFLKEMENQNIKYINDLNSDIITSYLLAKGKSSNKTFNNILNDLKQVFETICQSMKIENPCDGIKQKSVTRGDKASIDYRSFTDDELSKILGAIQQSKSPLKKEWEAAFWIGLYTGLRFKDVALLQWTHIIENKYIELIPAKTETKTNKAVLIRLSNHLKNILSEIPMTNFYVLPGIAESYNPLIRQNTKFFRRILKRLEFSGKIGFHSLRSTFITKAENCGIKLPDLMGVVGHTTVKQTKHYNKNAINVNLDSLSYKIM